MRCSLGRGSGRTIEQVARLGAQLLLQAAIDREVVDQIRSTEDLRLPCRDGLLNIHVGP